MKSFPDSLQIHVTEDDINEGVCSDVNHCAIALAALRVLEPCGVVAVEVDTDTLIADTRNMETFAIYNLPVIAGEFIGKFDDGKQCQPTSFAAQLDAIHWTTPRRRASTTLEDYTA